MTFSAFLKILEKYYGSNVEPYYKKDTTGKQVVPTLFAQFLLPRLSAATIRFPIYHYRKSYTTAQK